MQAYDPGSIFKRRTILHFYDKNPGEYKPNRQAHQDSACIFIVTPLYWPYIRPLLCGHEKCTVYPCLRYMEYMDNVQVASPLTMVLEMNVYTLFFASAAAVSRTQILDAAPYEVMRPFSPARSCTVLFSADPIIVRRPIYETQRTTLPLPPHHTGVQGFLESCVVGFLFP